MTQVECGAQRPLTGSALQARTDSILFRGHPEERPLWAGAPRKSHGVGVAEAGQNWRLPPKKMGGGG